MKQVTSKTITKRGGGILTKSLYKVHVVRSGLPKSALISINQILDGTMYKFSVLLGIFKTRKLVDDILMVLMLPEVVC